jgi:hypothetical protein
MKVIDLPANGPARKGVSGGDPSGIDASLTKSRDSSIELLGCTVPRAWSGVNRLAHLKDFNAKVLEHWHRNPSRYIVLIGVGQNQECGTRTLRLKEVFNVVYVEVILNERIGRLDSIYCQLRSSRVAWDAMKYLG